MDFIIYGDNTLKNRDISTLKYRSKRKERVLTITDLAKAYKEVYQKNKLSDKQNIKLESS
jgi:hypothetical protein